MRPNQAIKVCHLASGDLWAGAEVQLFALLKAMNSQPDIDLSLILLNEGKLAEQSRQLDIDVQVIDERTNSFWSIRRKLITVLRDRQIDILHSHRYKENLLAVLAKRQIGVRKLVRTVHGLTEKPTKDKTLRERVISSCYRLLTHHKFDRIICVSHDIQTQLSQADRQAHLVTIHNAVEVEILKPARPSSEIRDMFNLADDSLVIGTAGRMVPVKGYDLLLRAFKLIAQKEPRAFLLLAGDGPLKPELERLASALDLTDRIRFPGFCDDILSVVNSMDVFVMSSRHEGIPMGLLEAMALRRPIVVTSVGGLTEVIENGVSGRLVTPGDEQELARGCLELLSNPELASRMGEAAYTRVTDRFSTSTLKQQMTDLYHQVAER